MDQVFRFVVPCDTSVDRATLGWRVSRNAFSRSLCFTNGAAAAAATGCSFCGVVLV